MHQTQIQLVVMKIQAQFVLVIFTLLITLPATAFSQATDTIVDSHYTWAELQKKLISYYRDSGGIRLTAYQKQQAIQLISMQLSLVNVAYIGYDNRIHAGQIICHRTVVSEVQEIFSDLLQMRFPIYQCKPISGFGFSDIISMQANNSNGFDYRLKTGSVTISKHSYGLAIDFNPLQNPYKKGTRTLPENNNENIVTGRIRITEEQGQKVIRIFRKHGWLWGGSWRSLKDYMHFEKR